MFRNTVLTFSKDSIDVRRTPSKRSLTRTNLTKMYVIGVSEGLSYYAPNHPGSIMTIAVLSWVTIEPEWDTQAKLIKLVLARLGHPVEYSEKEKKIKGSIQTSNSLDLCDGVSLE